MGHFCLNLTLLILTLPLRILVNPHLLLGALMFTNLLFLGYLCLLLRLDFNNGGCIDVIRGSMILRTLCNLLISNSVGDVANALVQTAVRGDGQLFRRFANVAQKRWGSKV